MVITVFILVKVTCFVPENQSKNGGATYTQDYVE